MKKWKKSFAALLSAAMLLGLLAACDSGEKPSGASGAPDATPTPAAADGEYPITPEELGSGEVKWSEEKTADGWMKVTNEGGETLGYSPDSGVKLIQVGGFAFKDLNRNGKLDLYEDWRQEDGARAADLAASLTVEECAGLKQFSGHQFSVANEINDDQKTLLDHGVRSVLNAASAAPTKDQAQWNNAMQAYAEGAGNGIPVNLGSDPRSAGWPSSLAVAATFDSNIAFDEAKTMSKVYRSLGITTLLGPQMDLATEPRWSRITGTYGEDPALSRDMTNASTSGYQSTYDASGNDMGWGLDSVNAMLKHWPGDGAAQSGRESHNATGKYAVYPGGQFETALIAFVDGGFNLDSSTGSAASIMPSYSIAWSDDESLGELVGSSFSEYKIQLLRSYGFDGVVCSDWGVTLDVDSPIFSGTPWGTEDIPETERCYIAYKAGVDQIGGMSDPQMAMDAYELLVDDIGEDSAKENFSESARRILKGYLHVGLFENAYVDVDAAVAIANDSAAMTSGYEAMQKSVVMLKNSDGTISENSSSEKPTVYVPLVYTAGSTSRWGSTPASADLPIDRKTLDQYFNVVTDTVSTTLTGPVDDQGEVTLAPEDIIRASEEELAGCDFALLFVSSPNNVGNGYDSTSGKYIPLSLQYEPYTANSESVRSESIAGPTVEVQIESPYGVQKVNQKENIAYYGETANISNASDLDIILSTASRMPESAKIIVCINASNPMVFTEFEDKVNAILIGFGVDNEVFLDIASGKVEPSGLLPLQMPANMETVEAQYEDVPRDMECHVDANGNTYDFGFGMNWSGVIQDERTAKYCVPALTAPETVSIG